MSRSVTGLSSMWLVNNHGTGMVCLMLCVLLCSRRLSAHSVFLVVAGCLGPCLCAVLALLVRVRGLAFRLGGCLLGFPAVVCAVTPFPLFRLFVIWYWYGNHGY